MTELERRAVDAKAAEAWSLLHAEAMPVPIALDFVQDVTDDRASAKRALFAEAIRTEARAAPKSVGPAEWGQWADDVLLLMRRRAWDAADYDREGMRVGVTLNRRAAARGSRTSDELDCELWLSWLASVKWTIDLCRRIAETP